MKIVIRLVAFLGAISCLAQQAPRPVPPPLALKVEWVRPANQENTKVRYMPVQENISDPNVEMKFYGAAKQTLTTGVPVGVPGNDVTPYGVWSGTAEGPFAATFRLKNSYLDLTGLASVRWYTKTSGFHAIRPVLKLANGTMLVGDAAFTSVTKLTVNEFSVASVHWVKLNPDKVVTVNSGPAAANVSGEIWAPNVDLSKVDEIGFVDLMPGSGHGTGGWIQLGNIEVFGKLVARAEISAGR